MTSRGRRGLLAVGLVVMGAGSACGAFGGGDSSYTIVPPEDAGADAQVQVDGEVVVGHDAGTCLKTERVIAEADSLIASSDNMFGGAALCNVHIGACIARFKLSAAAAAAVKAKTASELSLTLTRAVSATECGGGDGGCLTGSFTTASGGLAVAPLRSDWKEPTVSWSYTDKPSTKWGMAGAKAIGTDRGNVAGNAVVDATSRSVTIPLQANMVDPIWVAMQADGPKLSFIIEAVNGGNFVFITKEAATTSGTAPTTPPATLALTYPCGDGG